MRRGSKRRGESVFVFCVGFVCAESAKPAAHCKKYILTRVEKRTKRGGGVCDSKQEENDKVEAPPARPL